MSFVLISWTVFAWLTSLSSIVNEAATVACRKENPLQAS